MGQAASTAWDWFEPLTAADYHELLDEEGPVLAPPGHVTPESRLALDQVLRALVTVFTYPRSKIEAVGEDLWWIFWDPEPKRLNGFEWCCDHAGLSASVIRAGAQAVLERHHRFLPAPVCTQLARYARVRRTGKRMPKIRGLRLGRGLRLSRDLYTPLRGNPRMIGGRHRAER